jgi:hypothetical protein
VLAVRAGPVRWRADRGAIAFAFLCVAAGAWLLHLGRDTTFFYDDWWFVTLRLDWSPRSFLEPHHEHLSALPVLVYKVVLEAVGLDGYGVLRVGITLLAVGSGALAFTYVRARLGSWAALALTAPLLVCGPGYVDLLWPFQIGFAGSLAFGTAALIAIDRERWRLASAMLAGSLACSAIGVPILAGVALELCLRRTKLWVAALPAAAFALWFAVYGSSGAELSNAGAVPQWIDRSATAGFDALLGWPGWMCAIAAALLAGWLCARLVRSQGPRLAGLVTILLAFWFATALGRAHMIGMGPHESRYIYPSAVLLVLVLAESMRGVEIRNVVRVPIAAAFVLGALVNVGVLSKEAASWRGAAQRTQAMLTALHAQGVPDVRWSVGYPESFSRGYAQAVGHYGSRAGYTPEEARRRSPAFRQDVIAAAEILKSGRWVPPGR